MTLQQKPASAMTMARRHSLVQVLGLSTTDDDIDGADVGDGGELIDGDQIVLLDKALRETGSDLAKFLAWVQVETLDRIPKSRFDAIMAMIESKKEKA